MTDAWQRQTISTLSYSEIKVTINKNKGLGNYWINQHFDVMMDIIKVDWIHPCLCTASSRCWDIWQDSLENVCPPAATSTNVRGLPKIMGIYCMSIIGMCTKLTSDTKVRGLYPLGTTNVCTTFHSTPFLRCLSLDQRGGLTDIPTHRAMSLKRIINMSNKKVNFMGRHDGMWLKIYMAKKC